jgi:transposase-like protein
MVYRRQNYAPEPPAAARPSACPYCRSGAVGTLAKVVTDSTCWKCQACGESWTNAQAAARATLYGRR